MEEYPYFDIDIDSAMSNIVWSLKDIGIMKSIIVEKAGAEAHSFCFRSPEKKRMRDDGKRTFKKSNAGEDSFDKKRK